MTANERRNEIVRILSGRRKETMGILAIELGVTERTIRNDITILMAEYPLETMRGNGGGVKMADDYYPHCRILSQEQENVLVQLMEKADTFQQNALCGLLVAHGSLAMRKKYGKEENL